MGAMVPHRTRQFGGDRLHERQKASEPFQRASPWRHPDKNRTRDYRGVVFTLQRSQLA